MTPMKWYETYSGPKSLSPEVGGWVAKVGWNVTLPEFGATGREATGIGPTVNEAVKNLQMAFLADPLAPSDGIRSA